MDQINIYTDGAAKGNPGPGGYGIILEYNGIQKEISEGFRLTTNNRMELLAVIVGLENIKQKGPKNFEYHIDIEIENEMTPKTWTKKLI